MPRVSDNVVMMKFILFALKDDVKRWMHGLKVILFNCGVLLLISSLRDTFLLVRPLDVGMKFSLLSNLNMSHFETI